MVVSSVATKLGEIIMRLAVFSSNLWSESQFILTYCGSNDLKVYTSVPKRLYL